MDKTRIEFSPNDRRAIETAGLKPCLKETGIEANKLLLD